MQTRTFVLRFSSPAFLGDAEQNGAWRTPPIKALLRQWWRVAYATSNAFPKSADTMRRAEAELFGHAGDEGANRSLVRLRLDRWDQGKQTRWDAGRPLSHPEVKFPVDSFLYMGYGPVTLPRGSKTPALKSNAAIQAGETASLRLAFPDGHAPLLDQALWLMDRYGTLGGRSRNGWGSFALMPSENVALGGKLPLRDWKQCLALDWPHAIGEDEQGALIWQTVPQADWKQAMTALAELKVGLRTKFTFTTGKNAPCVEARHWLSYPVTNHSVGAWGQNLRLPNSLRFKLRSAPDGKLVGVVFHVPCLPPPAFRPDLTQIKEVWKTVHQFLDDPNNGLRRVQE